MDAQPRLSLVIPTTGSEGSVIRLLQSIVNEAPQRLLLSTEVIVFLNKHPLIEVNVDNIKNYVESIKGLFFSGRFEVSDTLHLTAEASACAAVAYATGEYLWIVGDKRIFLPEGLQQLAKFIDAPPAPCAYFNSVRQERNGYTNAYASTYSSKGIVTIPYKRLVQKLGINFMPTNMGAWIFQRKFLDLQIWKRIIETCAPHFSHVITLLLTMRESDVVYYSVFLTILELKPYHSGEGNEWAGYAKLAGTYRYYPWTFGIARQLKFLIDSGVYTYLDVRRSMCSEATHLGRQIDEIYPHLVEQLKEGWVNPKERITQLELDEMILFLGRACPEKSVINGLVRRLYDRTLTAESPKYVNKFCRSVLQAIALDSTGVRLGSMIVGQIGDRYIRLHPDGYLISPVRDNVTFLLAFKLVDPPRHHANWTIIEDHEIHEIQFDAHVGSVSALVPISVGRDAIKNPNKKRRYQKILRKLTLPFIREYVERKMKYIANILNR